MRDQGLNLHDYSLKQSLQHRDTLRAQSLSSAALQDYQQAVDDSFVEQKRLEDGDTEDFSSYVARYHAALKQPCE